MKTSEIVIGSQFVIGKGTSNPTYVKVDEVLGNCVSLHGREFTTFVDTLEPIPITPALLLGNGFVKADYPFKTEAANYIKEVCSFHVKFSHELSNMPDRNWYLHVDNEDRSTVAGCDVQYVHQAQALMAILGVELEFKFS